MATNSSSMDFQRFFAVSPDLMGTGSTWTGGHLVLDGAVELARPSDMNLGWKASDTRLERTGEMRRLMGQFGEIRDRWLLLHPHEVSQRKVSLHSFHVDLNAGISCSVDETEWSEVKPIHDALSRGGAQGLRACLAPYVFDLSESPVPNILGLHGILETSDNMIVVTQRSRSVKYHPLHWSVSFEEQLEPSDLVSGGAAFHAAGSRGVNEEFLFEGAAVPSNCRLLALLIESRILNPAVVAYIRIPFSSDDLLERQRDLPQDREEFEQGKVSFVPGNVEVLARLATSEGFDTANHALDFSPWHPTSRYRLLIAMIHKFGTGRTLEALDKHVHVPY